MGGLLIVIGLLFDSFFLRRYARQTSTFNRATLCSAKREEESKSGEQRTVKKPLRRRFSLLWRTQGTAWFQTWLFGRSDEVAFEIVSQKIDQILHLVPLAMRNLVEQISAAYSTCISKRLRTTTSFNPKV